MGVSLSGMNFVRKVAPSVGRITVGTILCVVASCAVVGCAPAASSARYLQHQALVEKVGLHDPQAMASLKVSVAVPEGWERLPLDSSLLYTHQQWRSATLQTGVGVAYIHLPLPLSAKMLIWFAQLQYSKNADPGKGHGGQLLGSWTDSLGRQWFEAENSKYHVRGYAMTHKLDAWIVYSGYRVNGAPRLEEISMAQRCADSIAPLSLGSSAPSHVSYSAFALTAK